MLRMVFSTAGAVLGTRALLHAIGVGSASAVVGSAALNWILKDGLGRLGAVACASAIGNRYDNDSKSWSLLGDATFELGVGVELCAPLCPPAFLFIGSLANALKSTSYMLRLPPRASFLKAFARRENVGDLSAKANSQDVVASMLGLCAGLSLAAAVGDSRPAAFAAYACIVCVTSSCSFLSLKRLRLATLNWARTRLLLRGAVAAGVAAEPLSTDSFTLADAAALARADAAKVPTPREVNSLEPLPSWLLRRRRADAVAASSSSSTAASTPPADASNGDASHSPQAHHHLLPVRYGAPLHDTAPTGDVLRRLASLYAGEAYLLSVATSSPPPQPQSQTQSSAGASNEGRGIGRVAAAARRVLSTVSSPFRRSRERVWLNVSVAEGARPADAWQALLQAALLQEVLLRDAPDGRGGVDADELARRPLWVWDLLDDTRREAARRAPRLAAAAAAAGWATASVLWTPVHVAEARDMRSLIRVLF